MEENSDVSKKSVVLKWGAISGLLSIIFFVVQDVAGIAGDQTYSWIVMLIGIAIGVTVLVMAHREFINGGDGYMNYAEGLGIGTLMAVVSSIISSVFTYIYISFINTSYLDIIKEAQIMEMEKQGLTDVQIEQGMKMASMFTTPTGVAVMGILGGIFMGFIGALIVSAFTKKSRPEFE
jgi:phosphatidylglycerophosphatase A